MNSKSRSEKGNGPGVLAVRSAAKLLLYTADYWQDEQLRSQGFEIDYAVDTDVITLFSAPEEKHKYAEVFDGDEEAGISGLLARVLGEFVLKEMGGAELDRVKPKGLIVIPPHDDELDRLILAIASKARTGHESAINALGAAIEAAQVESGDDLSTAVSKLVAQSPDLIAAIDPDTGPMAEARRLASLPRNRLINLRRYYVPVGQGGNLPDGCVVLPPLPENATSDRNTFVEYVGNWSKRLKASSPGNKPSYALRGDAIVLATLQWVNERFAAENVKRRLVLITGSKYLFDAARGCLKNAKRQDFVELNLRHPQAFLAAQNVFSDRATWINVDATDAVGGAILKWLLLFFPAVLKRGKEGILPIDRVLLQEIADGKDEFISETVAHLARIDAKRTRHGLNFPNEFLENWRDVIRSAAISRGLMSSGAGWGARTEQVVKMLADQAQADWSVNQFIDVLQAQSDGYLTDLLLSTSRLGVMQLGGSESSKKRVCGLPAVRFDKPYAQAQDIADALALVLLSNAREQIDFDIWRLYASLEQQDNSNYHALVIHALAYGGKQYWHGARTLCQAAMCVSDRLPEGDKRQRLGREAAYLLAVAERRLAKEPGEMKRAHTALNEAILRDPDPEKQTPDLRFQAEQLAQEAWSIQYEFYEQGKATSKDAIERFFAKSEGVINAAIEHEKGALKKWVIRQTVTNALFVLFVGVLDKSSNVSPDILRVMGVKMLTRLEGSGLCSVSAEDQKSYCDSTSDYAYVIGSNVWNRSEVKGQFEVESGAHALPHAPFDGRRRSLLKALVLR